MPRIRVTRVIVIEGEEDWVRTTLSLSLLRVNCLKTELGDGGLLWEKSRVEEPILAEMEAALKGEKDA